jgi:hypothetical protein
MKFMQTRDLRCQHIDYMVEGLHTGVRIVKDDEASLKLIQGCVPQVINAIDHDLHRMQFRNVISLLRSFQDIFKAQGKAGVKVLSRDQLATMHRMVSKYLNEYVSQSKKEINGAEYATLID